MYIVEKYARLIAELVRGDYHAIRYSPDGRSATIDAAACPSITVRWSEAQGVLWVEWSGGYACFPHDMNPPGVRRREPVPAGTKLELEFLSDAQLAARLGAIVAVIRK